MPQPWRTRALEQWDRQEVLTQSRKDARDRTLPSLKCETYLSRRWPVWRSCATADRLSVLRGGRMSRSAFSLCFVAASMLPAIAFRQSFLSQYKGLPYHDTHYQGGAQKIPGRVLCAFYDLGGEGVAYHDSDPQNHGSGELNPADGTYHNEFRIHEGVDTSYTKFDRKPERIDDNRFDKIVPPRDLPYVGWTEPGEWFNITVDVTHAGAYVADFLYTSNHGGTISIDVSGKDEHVPLQVPTTYDAADSVAWRRGAHWNLAPKFFKTRLNKGRNALTIHILTGGAMNLAYFEFKQDP